VKCDVCGGKGWMGGRDPKLWMEICPICLGSGKLTWGRVAALLDEDDATVRRIARGRGRPKTAARVFDKACRLLGWETKKQPELFQ
jgi:hypothetical protein